MRIGFIGAGNIARAMARGLVARHVCRGEDLLCVSGSGEGAARMAEQTGAQVPASRSELIDRSEIIVLAFKPQHLETIAPDEAALASGKLILSVLAGRPLSALSGVFREAANVVRIMPNTPAQIGKGVSTFCFLNPPSQEQSIAVDRILASLGSAYPVEESQLHIATVVNGCGPAFFFRIVQLVASSAEKRGLDRELAIKLASETGIGALELLKQSRRDPQDLIDEVVSPNGVTHALLASLDKNGLAEILDTATSDAVDRSVELSRPS